MGAAAAAEREQPGAQPGARAGARAEPQQAAR
jgi:hypothetical protein